MILSPAPLPDDDLELCSDILLSLETRDDITTRVLENTLADEIISNISQLAANPHDPQLNLVVRAGALERHWKATSHRFRDSESVRDLTVDNTYPPFLTVLPANKPASWKLKLTDEQADEASKLYTAYKCKKSRALSYFRLHPPQPMAWTPRDSDAWNEINGAGTQTTSLYHRSDWTPIYMSWNLQAVDVPIGWRHPDAGDEEVQEYQDAVQFNSSWLQKRLRMRQAREEAMKN